MQKKKLKTHAKSILFQKGSTNKSTCRIEATNHCLTTVLITPELLEKAPVLHKNQAQDPRSSQCRSLQKWKRPFCSAVVLFLSFFMPFWCFFPVKAGVEVRKRWQRGKKYQEVLVRCASAIFFYDFLGISARSKSLFRRFPTSNTVESFPP